MLHLEVRVNGFSHAFTLLLKPISRESTLRVAGTTLEPPLIILSNRAGPRGKVDLGLSNIIIE